MGGLAHYIILVQACAAKEAWAPITSFANIFLPYYTYTDREPFVLVYRLEYRQHIEISRLLNAGCPFPITHHSVRHEPMKNSQHDQIAEGRKGTNYETSLHPFIVQRIDDAELCELHPGPIFSSGRHPYHSAAH